MTPCVGTLAATCVAAALALAGCGGDGRKSAGGRSVDVKLTDAGCDPAELRLGAGPTTFEVANDGADAVTEFEILDGDRIVGEVENLAPGLSGHFSLTLKPGRYTLYCPGGTSAERGPLVVSGKASGTSVAATAAVAQYRRYVEAQTVLLVTKTRRFVQELQAGDIEGAKVAYAEARVPYERIEPVAESFGDLDPAIDARAGDVSKAKWTGFHSIEQFLWVRGATGPESLRTKLMDDVVDLQRRVQTIELEPTQVANGSVELLGEVSKSKITGEEERYSHIDLVDLEANVQGARAAYQSVRDLVEAKRPSLAKEIDGRFADVDSALEPYRTDTGFVAYTALSKAETRGLSRSIDALAEPLSEVGAVVAGQ